MAGCEFAVLVAEKGCFGGQYGRACTKEKLLVCRKGWCLRTEKEGLWKKGWRLACGNKRLLNAFR